VGGESTADAHAHGTAMRPCAAVNFEATSFDLVDGERSVSCEPASGSVFPKGTTVVECSASDTRGNTQRGVLQVIVRNNPPVALGQSVTLAEDTPRPIVLTATDVDDVTPSYRLASAPAHGTLTGTPPNLLYTPELNYNGPDSFTFVADDGAADSEAATVWITVSPVNDVPLVAGLALSATDVPENSSVVLSGAITDPDIGQTHVIEISWGDGFPNTTVALAAGTFSLAVPHVYLDDNPTGTPLDSNVVTVRVIDSDGGSEWAATTLIVRNIAPALGAIEGPLAPLAAGESASLTVQFSDPGPLDVLTCIFGWDDGSESVVTAGPAATSCTATHPFGQPGVHAVSVRVADDDGGSVAAAFQFVVVYDPNAGFVTGGGWITSPAGAYAANTGLTGKANFGFVSKYLRGAAVPTGRTEFHFNLGNLRFQSAVYEWLVVAGAKAQYKGSGTINGEGDYGFLLTATDGDRPGGGGQDKFRIKIVDRATNQIVYDNVAGADDDIDEAAPQELGGGSIMIHSR
jgi:hypothetical protein